MSQSHRRAVLEFFKARARRAGRGGRGPSRRSISGSFTAKPSALGDRRHHDLSAGLQTTLTRRTTPQALERGRTRQSLKLVAAGAVLTSGLLALPTPAGATDISTREDGVCGGTMSDFQKDFINNLHLGFCSPVLEAPPGTPGAPPGTPGAPPGSGPPEVTPDNWRGAASLSGDLADTSPSEFGSALSGDSGNGVTGHWNNGAECPGYPSGLTAAIAQFTLTLSPGGCGVAVGVPAGDYEISIFKNGYVVLGSERRKTVDCSRASLVPDSSVKSRLGTITVDVTGSGMATLGLPSKLLGNSVGEESAVCVTSAGGGLHMSMPVKRQAQEQAEKTSCTNSANGTYELDSDNPSIAYIKGTGDVYCYDQKGDRAVVEYIAVTVGMPELLAYSLPYSGECRQRSECHNTTLERAVERGSSPTQCYPVYSHAKVIGAAVDPDMATGEACVIWPG